MAEKTSQTSLKKADILRGLSGIGKKAEAANIVIDLAIYGGAALSIAYDLRDATRDVDAVVRGDPSALRKFAADVAEDEGWPADWLNDAVKGFLSGAEDMIEFPIDSGGLRIYVPAPEYMFAMKCMAMRPQGIDGSMDIADIEMLIPHTTISSVGDALSIVESFYPSGLITPKVRFGVEEIVQRYFAKIPTP